MRYIDLMNIFLYGLCAVLWGYRGLTEGSLYYLILAAVWFAGAAIWFVRYFKQNQNKEK